MRDGMVRHWLSRIQLMVPQVSISESYLPFQFASSSPVSERLTLGTANDARAAVLARGSLFAFGLLAIMAAALFVGSAGVAEAQTAPPVAPAGVAIDGNGINLTKGDVYREMPLVSIGGKGADGLSVSRIFNPGAISAQNNNTFATLGSGDTLDTMLVLTKTAGGGSILASLPGKSSTFAPCQPAVTPSLCAAYCPPSTDCWLSTKQDGVKLIGSGAFYYLYAADGTVAKYPYTAISNVPGDAGAQMWIGAAEIDYPAGEVWTVVHPSGKSAPTYVEISLGYAVTEARLASNLTLGGCTSSSCAGPTLSPSTSLGRAETWVDSTGDANGLGGLYGGASPPATLTATGPTGALKTYTMLACSGAGCRRSSVSDGRGTTTYSYSDAPISYIGGDIHRIMTTTITSPTGKVKTVVASPTSGNLISVQDASGTTTYTYDGDAAGRGVGRLIGVTYPEGNGEHYDLDDRGNVTAKYSVPKPNSGLSQTVVRASYPATCDTSNYKICNKAIWVQDQLGHQTDFTYDPAHGGVLTETAPAGPNGIRPQTRYTYGQFSAQYVRGGSMQAAAAPVWRLIKTSKCQTQTSCTGTADEVVTTYAYQSSSGPNNVRLLSQATSKGDGSAISNDGVTNSTTTFTYDFAGNVLTSDGPLPGSADTTTYKYDSSRWKIGEISPDPDGSGILKPRATKTTYRNDGTVATAFVGTVVDPSDATFLNNFQPLQRVEHAYDPQGRVTDDWRYGVSELIASKSYAYYDDGLIRCETVRMNLAQTGSDACSLATDAGYGPDRLTIYYYDASARMYAKYDGTYGQPFKPEFTYFTPNGKPNYIYDGNFNLTYLAYDGLDRLIGRYYPQATGATGAVNWSDSEAYAYDAADNATVMRKRDGQYYTYNFDNLNRLVAQYTPSNARNVSYTYDNLGRRLQAAGMNSTFNFTYDALGRKLTEAGPLGTVSSYYDIAGRRMNLVYPDGFNTWSTFDTVGEPVCQGEAGYATSALVCDYYDDLGQRTELGRGNSAHSWMYYDGGGRLQSWAVGRPDNGGADSFGYWYSPASQHVGKWLNNPAYEFSQGINVDRLYTHDNQNKMTVSGSTAIGYDARGNLTSAGSTTYGYDIENHLTSISSTGVTADYDALGRLFSQTTPGSGTTYYLYDGDLLLSELQAGTGLVQRRYVWGLGTDEPLVWYEGAAFGNGSNVDRRWLIGDERGSIVSVTNGSGAPMAFNTYDEYGIPGSSNLGRFQYTGQAWLSGFGLYHYKARAYSPTLGRFMQTDPVGYKDDRNLYAYTRDDPVNGSDPSGLENFVAYREILFPGSRIFHRSSYIADCMSCSIQKYYGYGPQLNNPKDQGKLVEERDSGSPTERDDLAGISAAGKLGFGFDKGYLIVIGRGHDSDANVRTRGDALDKTLGAVAKPGNGAPKYDAFGVNSNTANQRVSGETRSPLGGQLIAPGSGLTNRLPADSKDNCRSLAGGMTC